MNDDNATLRDQVRQAYARWRRKEGECMIINERMMREKCPTCFNRPGDGRGCNDPDGCGHGNVFTKGDRVVFAQSVERYPFFIIPAHTTGTVEFANAEEVRVRPDVEVDGCRRGDDWDGLVIWHKDSCDFLDIDADLTRETR